MNQSKLCLGQPRLHTEAPLALTAPSPRDPIPAEKHKCVVYWCLRALLTFPEAQQGGEGRLDATRIYLKAGWSFTLNPAAPGFLLGGSGRAAREERFYS